jgi:hypothetical protein
MDGDEVLALIVFFLAAASGAVLWYGYVVTATLAGRRTPFRGTLALTPMFCMAFLLMVLVLWSDPVVRGDIRYILLFLAGGGAFMALFLAAMPLVGHSIRLDVMTAANPASAIVAIGAMIGVTFSYSLANIGVGPTIWTTIGPAILASGTLLILWLVAELIAGFSEAITIERDSASALRLAGLLAGGGLILGRAVAGDWVSSDATVHDFLRQGWPAAVLFLAGTIVQRSLQPTPARPRPPLRSFGLIPSLIFFFASALWVAYLGAW